VCHDRRSHHQQKEEDLINERRMLLLNGSTGACHGILIVALLICSCILVEAVNRPNFVLMHMDDLGYGDVSFYSKVVSKGLFHGKESLTPKIDRMAKEGVAFTNYYASACVCSPSRAGVLTGRYPIRTGIFPGVLTPDSAEGLAKEEVTLPAWLKLKGQYRTFAVGKWHLGHLPSFLPHNHGFDKWTGVPYSHDFCPCPRELTNTNDHKCRGFDPPCPLMNNSLIVQQPLNLNDVVDYYVNALIEYISEARSDRVPFFAYYACHHTHHPQFTSLKNVGISERAGGRADAYGDAAMEMDAAVGRILDYLRTSKLMDNTYVFFASDNGAATIYRSLSGNNSPLRCGKGTTWDGGLKVPFIVWGANTRRDVVSKDLIAGMDVFPTICRLASISTKEIPRTFDGLDFTPSFTSLPVIAAKREWFIYYSLQGTADAVRVGSYKVHFRTSVWMAGDKRTQDWCLPDGIEVGYLKSPLVYNIEEDVSESVPLMIQNPIYKQQVALAMEVLRAHKCDFASQPSCDASKRYYCYHAPGERDTVAPWPPIPFQPWQQTARPCCPSGSDILVANLENSSVFSCVAFKSLLCAREDRSVQTLCNPSATLHPECGGRAVCASGEGPADKVTCAAVGALIACPEKHVIKYCPLGYFQCKHSRDKENALCTKSIKTCEQFGGLAYSSRPCGHCVDFIHDSSSTEENGDNNLSDSNEHQKDDDAASPGITKKEEQNSDQNRDKEKKTVSEEDKKITKKEEQDSDQNRDKKEKTVSEEDQIVGDDEDYEEKEDENISKVKHEGMSLSDLNLLVIIISIVGFLIGVTLMLRQVCCKRSDSKSKSRFEPITDEENVKLFSQQQQT